MIKNFNFKKIGPYLNENIYRIYGILLDHITHNLKFFIGKRKYFFFCFIKFIIIFDKKFKFKKFKIRNYYDYITVREIFILECYNLENLLYYKEIFNYYLSSSQEKIPLIIDCGSNIGASTYFFKQTYELAKIISIEADEKNFQLLSKNIDDDYIVKNLNAVGSVNEKYTINNITKDPRAFSFIADKHGSVNSITINDILKLYPNDKFNPFIIKIDIEGGEKNLFEKNVEWIEKFKIIIIEPHDWMYPKKNLFKSFLEKIALLDRDFIILNENIVSIRKN